MQGPLPAEVPGELFEQSLAAHKRKRRGVYFTPQKYAQMMAQAALGERLQDARYSDILQLKIVDPACGGGAFLIAAYRLLLAAAQRALRRPPNVHEKLQLLRSCIFGADVDRRALAVAAHSLSLVIDEPRVAALMDRNLLRGNALVDDLLPPHAFDAVLANPPYVFGEQLARRDKAFVRSRYRTSGEQIDLYAAFLELAVTRLCKPGGAYAFIVPDAILAREQRAGVRQLLLEQAPPHTVAHVGTVFAKSGAGVSAAVLVGERDASPATITVLAQSPAGTWHAVNELPVARVRSDVWQRFLIYVRPEEWRVLELLRGAPTLGSLLADARAKGISRGEEAGKRRLPVKPLDKHCVPVIAGEAVTPYALGNARYYVETLEKDAACYAAPKILVRKTDDRLIACAEYEGTATLQSVYNLHVAPEHFHRVLAVLNSNFARWFLKRTVTQYKRLMPQITQAELLSIPVPLSNRNYAELIEGAAGDIRARERIEAAVLEDLGIADFHQFFLVS